MRNVTTGFLYFAYLFLGMTVGAFLWRAGLGLGAGVAGTLGALGLLGAFHGIVTGIADRRALKKEIAQVREAHRLLADAMESTQGALTELAHAIESGVLSDTDALTGEVRMLESLVQQMSESIDERLSAAPHIGVETFEGRRQAQVQRSAAHHPRGAQRRARRPVSSACRFPAPAPDHLLRKLHPPARLDRPRHDAG